jgi:hypothetical protein
LEAVALVAVGGLPPLNENPDVIAFMPPPLMVFAADSTYHPFSLTAR